MRQKRRRAAFRAISMDMDAKACAVAAAHARAAELLLLDDEENPAMPAAAADADADATTAPPPRYTGAKNPSQRLRGDEQHAPSSLSASSSSSSSSSSASSSSSSSSSAPPPWSSSLSSRRDTQMEETVDVRVGDALATGLAGGSVDVVATELPFGKAYRRIDVGKLLRELHRILRPGGAVSVSVSTTPAVTATAAATAETPAVDEEGCGQPGSKRQRRFKRKGTRAAAAGSAVIVGDSQSTAPALEKALALHPFPGAWRVESSTPFAIGGIEVRALKLRRQPTGLM